MLDIHNSIVWKEKNRIESKVDIHNIVCLEWMRVRTQYENELRKYVLIRPFVNQAMAVLIRADTKKNKHKLSRTFISEFWKKMCEKCLKNHLMNSATLQTSETISSLPLQRYGFSISGYNTSAPLLSALVVVDVRVYAYLCYISFHILVILDTLRIFDLKKTPCRAIERYYKYLVNMMCRPSSHFISLARSVR